VALTLRFSGPGERRTQEGDQILFILGKSGDTGGAGLHDRQICRIRLEQKALRRRVIAGGLNVYDPLSAVDAPRLLPLVHEFFDLVHLRNPD
jgi:hypothetical protein